mgnify:CR=1 FL=1
MKQIILILIFTYCADTSAFNNCVNSFKIVTSLSDSKSNNDTSKIRKNYSFYRDHLTLPQFKWGKDSFNNYLETESTYTDSLANLGIRGTVVVYFTVDTFGRVSGASIEQSSGFKILDDDAVRIISKLNDSFFPAKEFNRTVIWRGSMPIEYIPDE